MDMHASTAHAPVSIQAGITVYVGKCGSATTTKYQVWKKVEFKLMAKFPL